VTDRFGNESPSRAWSAALHLRQQIAATAIAIAETEDWVADTLDRDRVMVSALSLSYSTPRYVSFNLALVAGSGDPVRQYADEQKYELHILRQDPRAGSRGR